MQQNTVISQAPPRQSAPFPSLETIHVRSLDPKIGDCCLSKSSRCVLQRVFSAPPGARQSLTEAGKDSQIKFWVTMQSTARLLSTAYMNKASKNGNGNNYGDR